MSKVCCDVDPGFRSTTMESASMIQLSWENGNRQIEIEKLRKKKRRPLEPFNG